MKPSDLLFKSPIRYAQGWEDHRVVEEGLKIKKDDVIASILASGDNALNMLIFEPKEIYTFEISKNQIFEMKLKMSAIKNLDYKDFVKVIGYKGEKHERIEIFNAISDKIDKETLDFWNKNIKMIEKGIAFNGWWEKYSATWKLLIRPLLGKDFDRYVNSDNEKERKEIFEKHIDKKSIRFISKIFSSKCISSRIFQDQAIKNIPEDFDSYNSLWKSLKHFFIDIDCKNNPYHYWIFTGKIPDDEKLLQPYLQEKNYNILKSNVNKVKIVEKDLYKGLKEANDDFFDCFYLSDIFDWMNTEDIEKTLMEVVRAGKDGANIINFVLSYDKGIPEKLNKNLIYNKRKSEELLFKERVGLYKKIYQWKLEKI